MSALGGIQQRNRTVFRQALTCSRLRLPVNLFSVSLLLFLLVFAFSPATSQQHSSAAPHRQQAARLPQNLQEAEALIQQGKLDEAQAKIQDELQRNPSSVEAYDMLGFLCTERKDGPNALEAFQKALKLAPNSTKTHNLLGNLYVAGGKVDAAEEEFQATLRIDPANQEANYNLALLLISKKQPAEAIRYLERVHPANVATRFNLIRAYLEDNRPQQALRVASELSAESKSDVQLHFTLGVLLASEKQYKEAELELERADALQPGTFEILYNLGQAYLRDGKYAKAEIALNGH